MTPISTAPAAIPAFLYDVLEGLSRTPRVLPCKYFYDQRGSQLFDEICELEEYYPTRCEAEVLRVYAADMVEILGPNAVLIEYGSGSSLKTRLLLDAAGDLGAYVPVDISREHLLRSARSLQRRYPALTVAPVCADFTQPIELSDLPESAGRRVVFFSGSTIGNFRPREAVGLLRNIARLVGTDGGLLIGVDLKKDLAVLLPAYNDALGVTAAFNLNLLVRMNRELGADFDLDRFRHEARWNDKLGRIEMHLVSRERQTVHLDGRSFALAADETICTEYSYKYAVPDFAKLAAKAGMKVDAVWTDRAGLYSVQYLTAAV